MLVLKSNKMQVLKPLGKILQCDLLLCSAAELPKAKFMVMYVNKTDEMCALIHFLGFNFKPPKIRRTIFI